MATYQAVILIPDAATFVADSEIGFVSSSLGYETYYVAQNAANASELLTAIGLYFTDVFGFGGTWSFTNVGETYTVTYETTSEINWVNTPQYGNFFAFKSDTDGLGARYVNFATLDLVEEATTTVCPTCQEITRTACESSYSFVAGLTPSTVYYAVIENNRGKRYVQVVTTDGSGDFAIDADAPEFPIGFFIPEQYKYTIKVYSDSTLINQQDLTVGSTIYQCITLGFVNTVTTTASADFGVDFLIDDELNYIVDDLGNTFSV